MNELQQKQIYDNSTKLNSFIVLSSSSPLSPTRKRTVINVIYISGIVFMIVVFFVLLWINLYSRRCWCWHDTILIHRFNRQWLQKRPKSTNTDMSLSKNEQQLKLSNDNDFP